MIASPEMAAPQRPTFPAASWPKRRRPQLPVLAVGGRALVVCPNEPVHRVALTEANGTGAVGTLADGAEITIVAWHARGSSGWRYQVRSSDGTVEGWLSAVNLRPIPALVAPTTRDQAHR